MYLWNTKALATKLKSGELSQHERFKYFFLYIVLTTVTIEFLFYVTEEQLNFFTLISSAIAITATVVGLILSYRVNKMGDDKEFIDRYVCVGLPIAVKLVVLLIGIGILYVILCEVIFGCADDKYLEESSWVDIFLPLIFNLLFWWRIIHHIGWISRSDTTE